MSSQNQIGVVTAREIERLNAISRPDGLITVGLQQVVKELHVELVVFHDHDGLSHPRPSSSPDTRQSPTGPSPPDPDIDQEHCAKVGPICYGKANPTA